MCVRTFFKVEGRTDAVAQEQFGKGAGGGGRASNGLGARSNEKLAEKVGGVNQD